MSTPSPFNVAREASNNFGNAFSRVKDENAIERILADAMGSGDPEVLQNSIGKILSQVSPERQGVAMQYLQNAYSNVQKRQEQSNLEAQGKAAAQEAGYTYGAHPQVAAQQVKDKAKIGRLAQYGLGSEQPQVNQMQDIQVQQPSQANIPGESVFKKLTDDQLVVASGAPDREISEPAKAELKRRSDEEKAKRSSFEPESDKLEAKRVSELATEIESEFKSAANENLRLERMETLDKEGNVSTPVLIKTLDFLGLPIGILSNPSTEEYRKLETDFIRDVSKVFPGGRITNYEIQSYLRTIPTLLNSPEGRKSIIRNRKTLNEAKKIRYDEYKKILKENNGKKPQNLGILLDERTDEKIMKVEQRFKEGIESEIEKSQQPIRMIDPQGNQVDIPPNQIERAIKAGARFR